jgi:hypothetical protein
MITTDTIRKIAALTAINHHTEAMIEGAKALGYGVILQKLKAIQLLQDMDGYLQSDLDKYRYETFKNMLYYAKRELDADLYLRFESAY